MNNSTLPRKRSAVILVLACMVVLSFSLAAQVSSENFHNVLNAGFASSVWNPSVPCGSSSVPVLNVNQVDGNVPNPTQTPPNQGADYSGGWVLAGKLAPGSNPVWPFAKRALPSGIGTNPSSGNCSYPVGNGTSLSSYVEIDNVQFVPANAQDNNIDCITGTSYCDSTFNLADTPCTLSNQYMCRIHAEIDQTWKQAGIAPPTPPNGTQTMDIQGYVYWDTANVNASWHSFSGWEIHPLAAWRFHNDATPEFYLSPAQLSATVSAGNSAQFKINLGALNGFAGTVNLSAAVSGTGTLNPSLSNTSITFTAPNFFHNMPNSILTVSTGATTNPGAYTVTVTGSSGGTTQTATVTVNVAQPGHFEMSASPNQMTISLGSSSTSTITLTSVHGFSGTVTLKNQTQGLVLNLSPTSLTLSPGGTGSATLNVTVPLKNSPGQYTVTVSGTWVSGSSSLSNSTTITIYAADFQFASTPPPQTIQAGSSGNVTLTLSDTIPTIRFTGIVSLSASVSPQNSYSTQFRPPSVSLSQSSITATSTMTISTVFSATSHTYTIQVNGTSGPIVRSVFLTVTVTSGPNFSIKSNPSSLNVLANNTATTTITVSSQFLFTGTVNLSVTVAPVLSNGVNASLSANSVTVSPTQNGVVTLFISTSGLTISTNYTITVTGTGNGVSNSEFVKLEVSKFSLTASPSSMTFFASSHGTSIIGVNALGHFSGTITVNVTVSSSLPYHPTASLDITSITVPPGGTSTLNVTTTSNTVTGTYTVTIQGTSGKYSSIIRVTVTVSKFSIAALPSNLLFSTASSQTSKITLTSYNGFSGTVTLSAVVLPNGVASPPTTQFSQASVSLGDVPVSSNLTITITSSTAALHYNITVTATYSTLVLSRNLNVTVIKFIISGPVTPLRFPAGGSGNATIGISIGGFSGTVCLKITLFSSAIGYTTTPSSACVGVSDGGTGSVIVTVLTNVQSTPANTYSVRVVGTSVIPSGTSSITINSNVITFAVEVGRFSLSTTPTTVYVLANTTYTGAITVQSLADFSGIVSISGSLNFGTTPFPPQFVLNPQVVTLTPNGTSTVTLQIITSPTTTGSTTYLTITGFNGSLASSPLTITIKVMKFNIVPNPTSLSFPAGSFATSALNVTSLASGFSGTVTLTVTVSSSTLAAYVNPSTLTIPLNSWQPSILNVTSFSPGSYTVKITGLTTSQNGQYSKTISIPVVVSQSTTISTRLSASTIPVGSSVVDSATLAGATSSAGGTVTYAYWNTGACTGTKTTVGTVTVTNAVVPNSAPVTFNNPGPFSWNATYSGDASNKGAQSQCEPLNVNPPATVSTLIKGTTGVAVTSVIVGTSIHDTATISGGSGTFTGTVSYHFFNNGACSGFPVNTQAVTIGTGNIVPDSSATTPAPAGPYSYNATYSGDANNSPATSACESLVVNKATPTISSTVTPSTITVGQSATDLASVAGGFSPTGTVTYTVYSDPSCTALASTFANVALGSQSAAFAPTSTGTFQWISTYNGDANNNMVATPCGSEPLTAGMATPSLTTTITPSTTVTINTPVTDHASITGGFPSSGVTGTVTYTFFANGICGGTGTPEGTVTIGSGNSVPPSNQVTPTTPSSYSFNATYSGDGNNKAVKSVCELLTVQNLPVPTLTTTTKNAAGVTVTSIIVGDSIHDTAMISGGSGTITGSVTYNFFGNGGCTGSPASAQTVTIGAANVVPDSAPSTPSPAGPYGYQASYGGDANNGPTTSACEPLTVTQASSTTTVASSANPSVFGQPVTFTATVTGSTTIATPTGTVQFRDGTAVLATVSVTTAAGLTTATFTTSSMAVGSHSITAVYSGDTNFTGSTNAALAQTVNKAGTTTTVASSANPSAFGQSVTFTATVTVVAPGAGSPSGSVTFLDGTVTLGTGTLSGTTATFSTSALAVASHSITASYSGDASFGGSTSVALTQTVSKTSTTTTVTSSANPSVFGQSVTFTATVTVVAPGAGSPSGAVTFLDGTVSLGTGALSTGTATFATSALAVGSHSITASYAGDTNFSVSTSAALAQTVNKASTTTTVASSVNPSVSGQSVTFTATVTVVALGAGSPSGIVTFLDGTTTLGTGTLSAGTATFTTSTLAVGAHSITANYAGDTNFSGSTSPALTQTVNASGVTIATTIQNASNVAVTSIVLGTTVHDTATLNGQTATAGGTVTYAFWNSGTCTGTTTAAGTVTVTNGVVPNSNAITPTATGSYSFNATYSGDTNNLSAKSSCEPLTVTQASTTTSVTSSANPSVFGQPVTFTATVVGSTTLATPTGTVTFLDGTVTLGTGTLSSGTASFTTSALAVGSHSITASYAGDANFLGSTSAALAQTVNKATPSITTSIRDSTNAVIATVVVGTSIHDTASLSAGFNPGASGSTVTYTLLSFTALPSSSGPCSGGTVVGTPQTVTIASPGVVPDSASTTLNVGFYGFSATFNGDANNNAATSNCEPLTVNKANPIIATITKDSTGAAVTSVTIGTSVHDTATMSNWFQAGGTVTYTIFGNGACSGPGTVVGSPVTVANGVVPDSAATTPSPAGSYSFQASYGGDANNNAALSSCEPLAVSPLGVNINTVIKNSAGAVVTSVIVGTAVHDTATLNGATATASGTVTYNLYSGTVCSGTPILAQAVPVANGVVPDSKSLIINVTGTFEWQASYSGDPNNKQATGACGSEQLTVNPTTTTTSTNLSSSSTVIGQSVSDSASISGFFGGFGTGGTLNYKVFSGTTCSGTPVFLQTVNVDPNTGAVPRSRAVQFNSSATYQWQAIYNGDSNNGVSSSSCGSESLSVGSDPTTTSVTCSPASFLVNTSTSCTVTVRDTSIAPITPTGSASLTLDSSTTPFATCNLNIVNSTSANCTASFLATPGSAGSHIITAAYSGDLAHPTSSTGSTGITVTARATSTSVSCVPGTVPVGQPSTCTATVTDASGASSVITPTGSVAFSSTGSAGSFAGSPCSLVPGPTGTASCHATFTPSVSGIASITGAYAPGTDTNHSGSDNTASPATISAMQAVSISTVIKDSTGTPVTAVIVGTSVHDTATITGATTSAGGSVTYNFFTNSACTGTATSQLVTVTNGAVPDSSATTPAAAGQYSYNATYSGDASNSPARSTCEPLAVSKASPTISTTVKDSTGTPVTSVTAGATVHDSSTLSNGFAPIGGTVNYTFFSNGACTAPGTAAGTVTVTNGLVPDSSTETPTTPGSYSFQAIYQGDSNNNPATSSCEPLNVTAKLTPTLTTTIKDSTGTAVTSVAFGAAVHDTATFSGGFPTITGTVTYTVFNNNACTGPGTLVSTAPVGPGNSVPDSSPITPPTPGSYSFQASYAGDANNNPAISTCELLTVNKAQPSINTTINPSATVSVGSSVSDTASLSGGFNPGAAGSTVTYTFYSFAALPSATAPCAGGTAVGAAQTPTITTAGIVPSSTPVTPSSAGFYGFSATFNGDANNNAATSNCEPLTVNKANPTIGTVIKDSTGTAVTSVTVGTSVHDTATMSSGFQAGGTVTYTIFSDAACTTSGTIVGTPVSVTNGAIPDSAPVSPSSAGSYGFEASYGGDVNNNIAVSPCEPLTVSGDYAISANPASLNTDLGIPLSTTITVTSNGFSGSILLSASSSPSGLGETFSFNPVAVSAGGTGTSNMTITVPLNLAPGAYTITVKGVSGSLSHTAQITVIVADFGISASLVSPSAISAGSNGASTITINAVNGFSDTVTLSASPSSPTGLSCSLSTPTIQGSGTSTLSCTASNPADYSVTISGTVTLRGGSLSHATAPVSFHVVDFGISATSPASFTGSQGSTALTVTPLNNFQGTVKIAWVTSPTTGLTVSCPTSLNLPPSASTSCQLTASSPGSYSVNITGTSGTLSHSRIVTVNAEDFAMSSGPSPLILSPAQSSKFVVNVTSIGGFSSQVGLTASSPDPSIFLSPTSTTTTPLAGGTSVLTFSITTSASTAGGDYTITIQGNSGSLTHQTSIIVRIQDFSIASSPSAISLQTGSTGSTIITLASLNGFSGNVSLTVSASGVGATPGQSSINLAPGASLTTSLTIFAQGSRVGTYTVSVTGKSGGLSHSIPVTVSVTDFTISSTSTLITVQAGSSGTTMIQLAGLNGFAGDVSLTATTLQSGIRPQLNPIVVTLSSSAASGLSTLTVSVDQNTPTNTYMVTVTGSVSSLVHSTPISISVGPAKDFSLQANPSSLSIIRGTSQDISITVTSLNGFTGLVNLSALPSPAGLRVLLTPSAVTLTANGSAPSTLSVSTDSSTPTTSFTITVTGVNQTTTRTVKVTVTVADFSLSSNKGVASPMTIASGSSDIATITVASQGQFGGPIIFTTSSTPLSPTFNPGSVNLVSGSFATSFLTIGSGSVAPGSYSFLVIATSGSLAHNITLTINVVDFGLSPSVNSLTFPAGSSGTVTLNISSLGGFVGTVSIGTNVSPTGLTASCTPSQVPLSSGGTATSTCRFSSGTPGQYGISVTGSSGTLSHTVQIAVTVGPPVDFQISASPSSLIIPLGSTNMSIITLSSINSFNGTISLSPQTTLSGSSVTLTAYSVILTAGGSQTTTLTVSSPVATSFTVTVTGNSGSFTHSVTIPVRVVDFSISAALTVSFIAQSSSSPEITLQSTDGFSGDVSMTVAVSASGLSANLIPSTVTVPANSFVKSSLSLSSSTYGDYTVTITASSTSAGSNLTHKWSILVHVTDFSIATNPSSLPIQAGTQGNSVVNLNALNGFTGTVSLSASSSGPGVSANLNPNSVSVQSTGPGTSTLTITVSSQALPNPYTITIIATVPSGLSHSAFVTVTVGAAQDFTIVAAQQSITIQAGTSGNAQLTITSINNFQGTVSLSTPSNAASINPPGVTLAPNAAAFSTLTVTSTVAGTFTVQILGSSTSPSLSHSIIISVTVVDFRPSGPSSIKTQAGIQSTSDIILTSLGGFSGSVSLTISSSPGLQAGLTTNSVTLTSNQQVSLGLTVSSSNAASYSIMVNATSGSLTHSITIAVTVIDFTISASPTSLTIQQGTSTTSTITLTSLNGFCCSVSLTAGLSSPGLGISFNPGLVQLQSGGTAGSLLTISATTSTNPIVYTVTVTGTGGGSLPHPAIIQVTVGQAADFSISASPQSITVEAGFSSSTTLTLTSINNFNGVVALTTVTSGTILSPSSLTLTPNVSKNSNLMITASNAGSITVTISAVSGTVSHFIVVNVSVIDFRIGGPATVRTQASSQGTADITVTSIGGLSGTIALAILPSAGLQASLNPLSLPLSPNQQASSGLTVSAASAANYNVTITAAFGQLSHSWTVTIKVYDFGMSANPSSSTLPAGTSTQSTITLTGYNGFCCGVGLSVAGLPQGMSASLNTNPVILQPGDTGMSIGISTLTITAGSATPGNTYSIIVTGTFGGGIPHTVTVTVTVTNDFAVSTDVSSLSFSAGGSGSAKVTVTSSTGFAGLVKLSVTGSPNGLAFSLSQQNVTLIPGLAQSVTLTVSADSTLQSGSYTITVTASSGPLSHNSLLVLALGPAPQIFVPQTTLRVNPGAVVKFTVNATDTDKSSTLTLTVVSSSLPSGASFPPASQPGGSVSSIFNWVPRSNQASGDYTVSFTVTDGHGGSSTSQVTIHVNGVSGTSNLPSISGPFSYAIFAAIGVGVVVLGDRLLKQRKLRQVAGPPKSTRV